MVRNNIMLSIVYISQIVLDNSFKISNYNNMASKDVHWFLTCIIRI